MTDPFSQLKPFVNQGLCEPFIRHIRFPRFKNLAPRAEIRFTYPITALIGPNGSNKSSILRALQACPAENHLGDYWFDTPLDPIDDGDSAAGPHRYVHGYRAPSGALAEVIKARVGKQSRGADYFETSTPRIRDGMSPMPRIFSPEDQSVRRKTRWTPIDKRVIYLDFRQELPAYDIQMHFNWRNNKNDTASKKSLIRRGSPHVQEALNYLQTTHTYHRKNRILNPAIRLDNVDVKCISDILGREYTDIRLVKHELFGVEGYTAMLSTAGQEYSEAYAGSGEFAAIMLVRAINNASARSLILFDEPETSLHPGAQRELMRFLATQCLRKKHQVVLATHSPNLVEELPNDARNLLDIDPVTGRVAVIAQSASPEEAFSRSGAKFTPRDILVEDRLADAIVTKAARARGKDFMHSINIKHVPGGVGEFEKRIIPVNAHMQRPCSIILDGDQRPACDLRPPDQVPERDLGAELKKVGINTSDILRDGGSGDSAEQRATAQRAVLSWIYWHVGYLPTPYEPERLLLQLIEDQQALNIKTSHEAKGLWEQKTRADLGRLPHEKLSSPEILQVQETALADVPDDHPLLLELSKEVDRLLGNVATESEG